MSKPRTPQEGTRLIPGGMAVPDCSRLAPVLSRIGDKWTILVVVLLAERPKRFNELRREIHDVSQRMLTLTLRGLERNGMVKRTQFDTVPPQVEYSLTALGQSLEQPMKLLADWILDHLDAIENAQSEFDRDQQRSESLRRTDEKPRAIGR